MVRTHFCRRSGKWEWGGGLRAWEGIREECWEVLFACVWRGGGGGKETCGIVWEGGDSVIR